MSRPIKRVDSKVHFDDDYRTIIIIYIKATQPIAEHTTRLRLTYHIPPGTNDQRIRPELRQSKNPSQRPLNVNRKGDTDQRPNKTHQLPLTGLHASLRQQPIELLQILRPLRQQQEQRDY